MLWMKILYLGNQEGTAISWKKKSYPMCQEEFIIINLAKLCAFIPYFFSGSLYCERYPNELIMQLCMLQNLALKWILEKWV